MTNTTTPSASDSGLNLDHLEALAPIGYLIATQDNRITEAPIFVVEQKTPVISDSDYNDCRVEWRETENGDYQLASPERAARLEELHRAGRDTPGWRRHELTDIWTFVTACFTEQGCIDYLARNGHNLRETRIYAYGSYRNEEFRTVRKALIALANQPAPTAAPEQVTAETMLRDMLAIQEACNLHTDEYAPGSVIEYIKDLENDSQPSEAAPLAAVRWEVLRHREGEDEVWGEISEKQYERFRADQPEVEVRALAVAAPSLPAAAPAAGDELPVKPWQERQKDAVAAGEFAGFPDTHMASEIAEWRARFAHQPAQEQASTTSVTEAKRKHLEEHGYKVVGYVMQNDNNNRCTVARGKVNWQSKAAEHEADGAFAASPVVRAQSEESADAVAAEMKRLHDALCFWLPQNDGTLQQAMVERIAGDAYLLVGYDAMPDKRSAEELGWITVPAKAGAQQAHAGADDQDAERWRAFLGSARIRILGSAGIKGDVDPNGNPHNGYAHFGMEIWTKYGTSLSPEQLEQMRANNESARDLLTKYADIAIEAQRAAIRAAQEGGEHG